MSIRISAAFVILGCALALVACGGAGQDKRLAAVELERAVASHPSSSKLAGEEAKLSLLLAEKSSLEQEAKARHTSFARMGELEAESRESYVSTYAATKLAELREVEIERLADRVQELEAASELEFGARLREAEDDFKLEIFNLRAQLASLRLKPEARALLEERLVRALRERAIALGRLLAEKEAFINLGTQEYASAMGRRLEVARARYATEAALRESSGEQGRERLLDVFPRPLDASLVALEKEILSLRRANVALKNSIEDEVAKAAEELAKEKGYKGVLTGSPSGEAADDITDALIEKLRK